MKNSNLILPIIAGAATAAALTYLFATDNGADVRGKISDTLKEHFPDAGDQLLAFKDKFMDGLSGIKAQAEEVIS